MPVALVDSVALELLIEGERNDLFQKITSKGVASMEVEGSFDPSLLSVQKVYQSIDGTELVFEVAFHFSKLHFYAFKFKGYLCCPAFLASFFGLTDYACLNVSNLYFYIFLYEKVDDPWKIMLEGISGLHRVHHFSAPGDINKVLKLDDNNKDTLFLLTPKDFFMMGVTLEFSSYERDPGPNPVQHSFCNPCYGYVKENLKNALNLKYSELFKSFIANSTAIVHLGSATYRKIMELHGKLQDSQIPQTRNEREYQINIPYIIPYRETDYSRESYILGKLTDHLRKNYEEGKDNKVILYYCATFSILQSSGYGKSRLMERLGSRIPTFYSSLQSWCGHPRASHFLIKLIRELDKAVSKGVLNEEATRKAGVPTYNHCFMNNVSTAAYIYILRIIFLILTDEKNKDQKLSQYFEIDSLITNHHLFDGLGGTRKEERIFEMLFKDLDKVCGSEEVIIFNGEDTIKLQSSLWIDGSSEALSLNKFTLERVSYLSSGAAEKREILMTNNLEDDVMNLLEKFKEKSGYKHLPSVFVIDSANGLLYDIKEESKIKKRKYEWTLRDIDVKRSILVNVTSDPHNIFRRIFRIYKNTWERLILITISTCVQINVALPELEEDPSKLPFTSHFLMENFVLAHTYSANSLVSREISAGMFRNGTYGIKDWKEFLESNFRKIEYFKFGRPLTYGFFKVFYENCLKEGRYSLEMDLEDCHEFSYLASKLLVGDENAVAENPYCLYSMFNFAFGTNYIPSCLNREELVEKYMMTLVKYAVDHDKNTSQIIGGFFPEGVLNFLSARYFAGKTVSLDYILKSSVKYGLCNIEDFGELLAQFILLRAIFFSIDCCQLLLKVKKVSFSTYFAQEFPIEIGW